MYFILSKVLLVIIQPFTWMAVLLIWATITKNNKKKQRLLYTTCAWVYFFANGLVINLFARAWDYPPNKHPGKGYSSAILLGGFISEDEDGNGVFNGASDRFIQATRLLANGTVKNLLFTGGNGSLNPSKFREGAFVKGELLKMGFPDSTLLIDSLARNTFENAANSKKLLKQSGLKPPYLLVTSAFHMRRAMLIYKREGINVIPYPSHYIAGRHISIENLIPAIENFGTWNTYTKEIVGYIVTLIK